MYFSIGIVLIYGFSVFIVPITEDTHWDRTVVAAVVAPIAIVNGLMSPVVGALTDRFGPRRVLTASSVSMAIGLAGIGFASQNLTVFIVAVAVASLMGAAQTGVPYTYVVVGWFSARRGLALGVMLSFVGLGIATVPPFLAFLISEWGWRFAFVAAGLLSMAVTLPVALFVIRDPPVRESSECAATEGNTVGQAVATASFWLMLGAFFLNYFAAAAGSISLPVVLADRGADPATAALAMSLVGLTFIVMRLGFGALLDRLPPVPLTSLAFLSPVVGHFILLMSDGLIPVYVSAVFFGLATGAEGDAIGYLLSKRFGMRSFGKLFGINYMALTFGAGLGPASLHILAAEGTRYVETFTIFACIALVAPILLILDGRTRSLTARAHRVFTET
ncbi:MFS transporter [Rhizobiaceae bacterium n13]|uniref:MFS transporter n=1 Tax=Ferirhizobium litorale TaxID=2927786 RepID=A0AAE3QH83_9HYPH|nr:MFS transporter [Fererhizobium litorale]MDI7862674.1 MFS transporter [Fererhizobium litorale]MDI7923843.1 MFS transporter [Fererhizobium litorale]